VAKELNNRGVDRGSVSKVQCGVPNTMSHSADCRVPTFPLPAPPPLAPPPGRHRRRGRPVHSFHHPKTSTPGLGGSHFKRPLYPITRSQFGTGIIWRLAALVVYTLASIVSFGEPRSLAPLL
jgi:hypothetical protein